MKKITFLLIVAMMFSCSNSDDSSDNDQLNQDLIDGWWYPGVDAGIVYEAYYFGTSDGVYQQDMSNFGLGIGEGTWTWIDENTIEVIPTPGGGIVGGTRQSTVVKLTQDSLVFQNPTLKLSRTNHSD